MMGTITERKILQTLFSTPEIARSESEIIHLAGTGKGSAAECIAELQAENIVRVERKGRTKMISLRRESPATFFLKQLFDEERKKLVQRDRLSAILLFTALVRETTLLLIVFGSTLARTTKKSNDIDFLIVNSDLEAVENARKIAEGLFGFQFNLHEETAATIKIKMGADSFVKGAVLKGVTFHGYELARELYAQLSKTTTTVVLQERVTASLKNYDDGDVETGLAIAEEILNKTLFLIAEKSGVFIQGRADAKKSLGSTQLGKIWKRAKNNTGRKRILILQEVVKTLIQEEVLHREGYL